MVSQTDNWNDMTKTSKYTQQSFRGKQPEVLKMQWTKSTTNFKGYKVTLLLVYPALGSWPIKNSESSSVGILILVNSKGSGLEGWIISWKRNSAFWLVQRMRLKSPCERSGLAPSFLSARAFWVGSKNENLCSVGILLLVNAKRWLIWKLDWNRAFWFHGGIGFSCAAIPNFLCIHRGLGSWPIKI